MPRWNSPVTVVVAVVLSVAGYAAVRGGFGPIEFGGTQTGTVLDRNSAATESEPFGNVEPAPEFEVDEPEVVLDLGGLPVEARPQRKLLLENDEAIPEEPSLRLIADEQPAKISKPEKAQAIENAEPSSQPSENPAETSVEQPVRIAKRPNETVPAIDLEQIDRQIKAGQLVEAHKSLSKLFWQQPGLRSRIQERIDGTANAIYFAQQPHVQEPYVVQSGDQLRKIATKYNVSWQYLSRLNRLDPKRLRAGQKLKVINGPFGVVVTLADFELVLHHNGQYVRSYRACIGKNGSSPVGKFKVLNKVTDPQYTDPDGKVIAGGDPKNPLGHRWIDLGESYGIHGTIEPDSIGKAESRGCIRLLNEDAAEVYDLLENGSEVVIRP